MKHCRAIAPQSVSSAAVAAGASSATPEQVHAQRGEGAFERKVADYGRLQDAKQQGIGGERIEARAVEQTRRRQPRRPSRHRPRHRLADGRD